MNLEPGATLGPYRILELYRRGGMATVYKGYHPRLDRYVAVKLVRPDYVGAVEFRERFQREARTVARLRHPHILEIFTYGEEQGLPYLVTEFVDGGSLTDRAGRRMEVSEVIRLLRPIATALDYAHTQGVLHRDVKPSNILLWANGTPVLADFGIAKEQGSTTALTHVGQVMGTPEYMAPEQALGEPPVGPATDQYALAVVAYEFLAGRVPFTATTPLAILAAHLHRSVPSPREANPAISTTVERVLLRALAKRQEDRFPSVTSFIDALAEEEPAEPEHVEPDRPTEVVTAPITPQAGRGRWLASTWQRVRSRFGHVTSPRSP